MKELSIKELSAVNGGDGGTQQDPSCTTNKDGSQTCTCPDGTWPAKVDGKIICTKPAK